MKLGISNFECHHYRQRLVTLKVTFAVEAFLSHIPLEIQHVQ